ncbi:uncharacterized protein LOC127809280 [Diospyros lotus]|uniref:uncharacterized protein LOC127809280 n=1 Tax=Diospyros lotus TaxID=55363 RepID=UPI002251E107|nr:uncharacterized protein LOC127809280 [Diospyros lotus]
MHRTSDLPDQSPAASDLAQQFACKIDLNGCHDQSADQSPPSDLEIGVDDHDFTFACLGDPESPVSADEAFHNGQIRPIFPVFDQNLAFAPDEVELPIRPPVKKVFVEADSTSAGTYCEWSGKEVEAPSPVVCKKSNSTGFSKLWRFRDLLSRSSSDGRDAFVFLNGSPAASSSRDDKTEKSEGASAKKAAAAGVKAKAKAKAKKSGKGQTPCNSAHELHYVRNKASREAERRRSYLPYRPELVGFFTNTHGGLSKNIHPY